MPSPFPGMDPYLERPSLWPDVHHSLLQEIRNRLVGGLRPQYFVSIEQRVFVCSEDDPGRRVIVPDLAVAPRPEVAPGGSRSQAGLAVDEAVELTVLVDEEFREYRLVLVDAVSRDVVTVIEVLSPANKVVGSRSREVYLRKRREVLHSPTHLVEIDLLREGDRFPCWQTLPPGDYYVHVSRSERRPRGKIWAIGLRRRLPVIEVPLRPPDPDFRLDLQLVLNQVYDRAGYDLRIDYGAPPEPPLTGEYARWASQIIPAAGPNESPKPVP